MNGLLRAGWHDLRREARQCPVLHMAVTAANGTPGGASRLEAAMAAAYTLSRLHRQAQAQLAAALAELPPGVSERVMRVEVV